MTAFFRVNQKACPNLEIISHSNPVREQAQMVQQPEQLVHDRINLGRLVRRLEKTLSDDSWNQGNQHVAWVKAQGTLQVLRTHLLPRCSPNTTFPESQVC